MSAELLLASRQCGECLLSPARIVSGERAAEIVAECRGRQTHFQCHKGSLAGINLHCRAFHDRYGSRAASFALAFDIPIREIDPESLEPRP